MGGELGYGIGGIDRGDPSFRFVTVGFTVGILARNRGGPNDGRL
jgi:hypothetical protein